jgi:hypothetical protein
MSELQPRLVKAVPGHAQQRFALATMQVRPMICSSQSRDLQITERIRISGKIHFLDDIAFDPAHKVA